MKKVLLATIAAVTLVAMPAFAAVQNIKVGGDINSTFLHRANFDLGHNGAGDEVQNLFLTQTSLKVDADLSDNVEAVVGLINERAWGAGADSSGTNNNDSINLYLAYAKLREMLYSPLTLVVGRQTFAYGNGFVFDATGPNNSATGALSTIASDLTRRSSLDAVRAILDYKPLTIEAFWGKVDSKTLTLVNDINGRNDDIDVFGTNINYKLGDEMNTELETYLFAKIDHSTGNGSVGAKGDKADQIYTPGLRASTNPIKGLNVQGEVAWQGGYKVTTTATARNNERRQAMGAEAIVNYEIPVEATKKWDPVVTGVYTYVSGDKNSSDAYYANEASRNIWTAWDPMFENQGGGTIYNTLFNLSNAHIITASGQVKPIEDVVAKVTWTGMWLADKIQSFSSTPATTTITLNSPDGTGRTVNVKRNERQIGNEFDANLTYNYTEDVQLGASFGLFLPGDLFTSTNEKNATQALLNVDVAF